MWTSRLLHSFTSTFYFLFVSTQYLVDVNGNQFHISFLWEYFITFSIQKNHNLLADSNRVLEGRWGREECGSKFQPFYTFFLSESRNPSILFKTNKSRQRGSDFLPLICSKQMKVNNDNTRFCHLMCVINRLDRCWNVDYPKYPSQSSSIIGFLSFLCQAKCS